MTPIPDAVPDHIPDSINERLARAGRLRLFLDYDGTLADFAPTPEQVTPDPEVIALLTRLAEQPRIRVAVISGRRLDHVETLVPLPNVLLAGTYGIELRMPGGEQERVTRVAYGAIRPTLEALKPRWTRLIADRRGFFLEDKGWAMALHARFADDDEAEAVLASARRAAEEVTEVIGPTWELRLLGGHKFLEVGPELAHKGRTVAYLLDRHPWPGALPLYVGDDDKDEEAFGVIKARGGIAVLVSSRPCETKADAHLESPEVVRSWLGTLPDLMSGRTGGAP